MFGTFRPRLWTHLRTWGRGRYELFRFGDGFYAANTDPNLVFNLRSKLDAAGHYDDFEVDRVVRVELKPDAKQSELLKALEPVVDRLLKRYKAAQESLKTAREKSDDKTGQSAQNVSGPVYLD